MSKLPITLCMIVKNEAHVIERCLTAIHPYITGFVIVDTGSSDDTKEVVQQILGDLPGEIHDAEWVNFGHNRNEALQLARSFANNEGYIFVIDADDTFVAEENFKWPEPMDADAYSLLHRSGIIWWRPQIYKASSPWRYEGVVHEWPTMDGVLAVNHRLSGCYVRIGQDGARRTGLSSKEKYLADAKLLQAEVDKNPDDTRSTFYLAQSYRDGGDRDRAIAYYHKRLNQGGWEEERWYSCFQLGQLYRATGSDDEEARRYLVRAFKMRPHRMEACVALAALYRKREEWAMAALWAGFAYLTRSWGQDLLFVDTACYGGWRACDEYSLALFYLGRRLEAVLAMKNLLALPELPASERPRIEDNYYRSGGPIPKPEAEPVPDEVLAQQRWLKEELEPLHHWYTTEISSRGMAMSLEAAAFICAFCKAHEFQAILDLGSGFSTVCFGKVLDIPVISVDDDSTWLMKTNEALAAQDLDAENLYLWSSWSGDDAIFDMISYDLGHYPVRLSNIEAVWKMLRPGGYIYFDDAHHTPLKAKIDRFLDDKEHKRFDTHDVTLDEFERWGLLVQKL